ncbi:hypothetical protein AOLI_G00067230 [Acnodon oligacanthus]
MPSRGRGCSVDVERVSSPSFSHSSTASDHSHEEPTNFNLPLPKVVSTKPKAYVDIRLKTPEQKIQDLALREKNLAEKLDLRLKNMDLREQNLDLRGKQLVEKQDQWEKNVNQREKNLDVREKNLAQREQNLAQREQKLAEELNRWEKNLGLREQNLAEKLNLKEKNLDCTKGQMGLSRAKYNRPTAVDCSDQKKSSYSDDVSR